MSLSKHEELELYRRFFSEMKEVIERLENEESNQAIISFQKHELSFELIDRIVTVGYNKTGRKFWVVFNGSKGYLDNIEIFCEGQSSTKQNRINIKSLSERDIIEVHWERDSGVIIEII